MFLIYYYPIELNLRLIINNVKVPFETKYLISF